MIVYLRSTDGNPDSRLQKYVDYVKNAGIVFHILCWDRSLKYDDDEITSYFHKRAEYGSGIKNLANLFIFNIFLVIKLIRLRKKYKVIHACDFDTIIPALFLKFILGKKVIYDIFDWYIDSRSLGVLKYFVIPCEFIALKFSDYTIICEEERKQQLCCEPRKLLILPNIPNLSFDLEIIQNYQINSSNLVISYVGVFTRSRGLEKILKYVSESSNLKLEIAGFGELQPTVEKYANISNRINYHGSVSYSVGLDIMYKSDIILAIYEKDIPNHIYAAPNKYYEGLFLGRPILTTRGTFVGDKTEKYHTGYAIEETDNDLINFFENITKDKLIKCQNNAKYLWEAKYSGYIENFMRDTYLPFIYFVK